MSSAFPLPLLSFIVAPCASTLNFPIPKSIPPVPLIAVASAQFQVRDPTVEREGPVVPLYGTYDCWQNPQSTPPDQPIVMPVHPTNIPLAPMYPPDFYIYPDSCSADAGPLSTSTPFAHGASILVMSYPR
eukprot:scaffold8341_cov128-Isochrysis_galbana.AAC.3